MSKPKKKFKETKVGKFLLGKSGIINVIGDIITKSFPFIFRFI